MLEIAEISGKYPKLDKKIDISAKIAPTLIFLR